MILFCHYILDYYYDVFCTRIIKMEVHWTVIALLTLSVSVTLGQFQLQESEPFILFTKTAIIHGVGLDGSGLTDVVSTNQGNVLGLDFDYRERVMFWTEGISPMSIMKGSIDGSTEETLLTGLGTAEGLAWDWVGRKIYWTDTENRTIEVLDPATGFHKTLINTGEGSKPRAIVVDPLQGWFYWTDWGRTPRIIRTTLDGLNSTTLHSTNLRWPNGLAIDRAAQKLYWVDADLYKIESSNTNGSGRTQLTTIEEGSLAFSLAYHNHQLFWSDWISHSIKVAPLDRPQDHAAILSSLQQNPVGLTVFTAESQPLGTNPCADDNGGCSHLCLANKQSPNGYTCVCPDGISEDQCYENPCRVRQPCQNGATCQTTAQMRDYICFCPIGYSGTLCDIADPTESPKRGPCNFSNPCLNGGVCLNTGVSEYECDCDGLQFDGTNCQNAVEIPTSGVSPILFVGVVAGIVLLFSFLLFSVLFIYAMARGQGCRKHSLSKSNSAESGKKPSTHSTLYQSQQKEPDYMSIKSNSPAPIRHFTGKTGLAPNHYVTGPQGIPPSLPRKFPTMGVDSVQLSQGSEASMASDNRSVISKNLTL